MEMLVWEASLVWIINLLIFHGVIGIVDAIYHHVMVKLSLRRRCTPSEYRMYSVRGLSYVFVFFAIAYKFESALGAAVVIGIVMTMALLWAVIEIALSIWGFSDSQHIVSGVESTLHITLAINSLALFGVALAQLAFTIEASTVLVELDSNERRAFVGYLAVGMGLLGVRDGVIARRCVV